MSLPGDALATVASPAQLLAPDNLGRSARKIDYELGGVGIGDASEGLEGYTWRARLSGDDVLVGRDPYDAETVLLTEAGISELSLAFDQNMRPMVAYVALGQAKLYWYDATVPGYATLALSADARSPFVSMDDKRGYAQIIASNDVLLFYLRTNRLCYRQQRDRFEIERTVAWLEGAATSISKVGMNAGNRLQVEIVGLQNRQAVGAVLADWTQAEFLASVTSIAGAAPDDIAAGDLLHAAVMHRGALTPPGGWSVVATQSCTRGALTHSLTVLRKDTAAPGDAGTVFTFTQAGAERMGLAYFVVRGTTGSVAATGSPQTVAVNDLATNTITAPIVTAAAEELVVTVATSANGGAAVTQPSVSPGMSLVSGPASQCRLGVAYQRRAAGQTNAGRFTFDAGSPTTNGLAAITLRFT